MCSQSHRFLRLLLVGPVMLLSVLLFAPGAQAETNVPVAADVPAAVAEQPAVVAEPSEPSAPAESSIGSSLQAAPEGSWFSDTNPYGKG